MAPLKRLTDRDLLRTIAKWPPDIQEDPSWRTFLLSIAIVKYYLGKKWIDQHLAPNGPPGFLRQDDEDKINSEQQSFKVVDLAELLFNLQCVEGFDGCIERIRQGIVEPTYAELDLGRMLYVSSIDFRFVVPQGKKGNDYDIEIGLSDWPAVCADAKCKIESTGFSAETVKQTLDKARKQFPPDLPSVIFVKVPSQWGELQQHATDVLYNVAEKFLRGTARVVSVKYYTSRIIWRDGAITYIQAFKELSNPNNRFDPSRNWDMFEEASEGIEPNSNGNFTNVPQRWRRLIYYPSAIVTDAR